MVRWAMLIDLNKCIGCEACTVACKAENFTPKSILWNRVFKTEQGRYPNVTGFVLPRPCMHCENPPCVTICPTGASYKRSDGIVLIDYDKCIGCKYCISACPYGVRQNTGNVERYFPEARGSVVEQYGYQNHKTNVAEKCTFCVHRIDAAMENGLTPGVDRDATPACVVTCHPGARIFGDLDNPESEVAKAARDTQVLLPSMGTLPKVFYPGPLPPDISTVFEKETQVLPVDLLMSLKDILKPLSAAAVGAVAVAAAVNAIKVFRERKKSVGGAK